MLSRDSPIPLIFRPLPNVFTFVMLILCLYKPSTNNLYDLIFLNLAIILNSGLLKPLNKLLYKKLNRKKLPILGIGTRPFGAHSCSGLVKLRSKPESSYGMPSGHSYFAWLIASYLITQIWFDNDDSEHDETEITRHNASKIVRTLLLLLFAFTMSWLRVNVEGCHTVQQVIIGGLFGIGIGISGVFIKKKIMEHIN